VKIKVEVEIFNDPKYCENGLFLCDFLDKDDESNGDIICECRLFQKPLVRKDNNYAFKTFECRIATKK